MKTVVFPIINERVKAILDAEAQKFNKKHMNVDFPPNSQVMVRVTDRGSKLEMSMKVLIKWYAKIAVVHMY